VTRVAAITTDDSASQREEKAWEKRERERERERESGIGLFLPPYVARQIAPTRCNEAAGKLQFHKFEWRLLLPVMRSYCIIS